MQSFRENKPGEKNKISALQSYNPQLPNLAAIRVDFIINFNKSPPLLLRRDK